MRPPSPNTSMNVAHRNLELLLLSARTAAAAFLDVSCSLVATHWSDIAPKSGAAGKELAICGARYG